MRKNNIWKFFYQILRTFFVTGGKIFPIANPVEISEQAIKNNSGLYPESRSFFLRNESIHLNQKLVVDFIAEIHDLVLRNNLIPKAIQIHIISFY